MSKDDLVGARWFKSSYSNGQGECVEVAFLDDRRVAMRDSKNPTGPALVFTPGEFGAFVAGVAAGEFNQR
ncbi:DUF397 domain-containing protein [Actinacidiphila sp. ITFR-21]|uniref:DUF397 domain-containing protein n=1 Tax=Actinacidiphila sp. ITFR-21 TaxID=3075199 RepID=UPI002889F9E9|nr:DUF397 domain-containing protein [Streptomyces sp. ITFR-21]WNI18141.1 DUF397 domain-containing protein [Streptomyces sp. ITFR-21]